MKGRKTKKFQDYLIESTSNTHVSHNDYLISPATAFLKYTIEAKSAIDLCIRKFTKVADGNYQKDSLDSIQHLIVSMLPAIMGHLETYQRYLFGGLFDYSIHMQNFDIEDFFKKFNSLTIEPIRLAAYRGIGASSIGILLADNMNGWHDPEKVNSYFKSFLPNVNFYSNNDIVQLKILWQLRHSIVHTGGTLTLSDAQKFKGLNRFADKQIIFENTFIYEVSRKLHPIIKKSTERIAAEYISKLKSDIEVTRREQIEKFFAVKSSMGVWLK